MSDCAVELYDVVKVYGSRRGSRTAPAVDQISLHVRQGEFFTLLGPSGCGKTTTLRMIAGFETPTNGELLIQGQPMNRIPPYARPVNTVFQNYALFPHLTVAQNVGFGLAVRRVPRPERRRRVAEALELVRLPEIGGRKTWQLSGGQQQRVALARALVNRPAVLLLDEPLGALDLKLRKEMQLELKHLQSKVGITFIYVTHDQEEALTMSDRIAVMCHGRVLQVADPVTIYEHPATRFVADFIGETNFVAATVGGLGDGLAWLSLVDCTLAATVNGTPLRAGQAVTCAVRPEKILLRPTGEDGPPAVRGIVREVVYIGTDTRYVVALASSESLVARVQNVRGRGLGEFCVGQEVAVSWLPEDARVLLDDGAATEPAQKSNSSSSAESQLREQAVGNQGNPVNPVNPVN